MMLPMDANTYAIIKKIRIKLDVEEIKLNDMEKEVEQVEKDLKKLEAQQRRELSIGNQKAYAEIERCWTFHDYKAKIALKFTHLRLKQLSHYHTFHR